MRNADPAAYARRKLRSRAGFTLAETLVVVLMALLTSGIVASTVHLAATHFRARTQEADAQLLCSSLSLFVQNELTYAGELKTTGADYQLESFTDHVQGFGANCSFVDNEGRLAVRYNGGDLFEATGAGAYKGSKTLTEQCRIFYNDTPSDITVDLSSTEQRELAAGTAAVCIEIRDENGRPIAVNSFAVRPLAP